MTESDPSLSLLNRARRRCEVPDCGKEHAGRGLCGTHYAYWRTHGRLDPTFVHQRDPARAEKFQGMSQQELADYCTNVINRLPDELPSWRGLLDRLLMECRKGAA